MMSDVELFVNVGYFKCKQKSMHVQSKSHTVGHTDCLFVYIVLNDTYTSVNIFNFCLRHWFCKRS